MGLQHAMALAFGVVDGVFLIREVGGGGLLGDRVDDGRFQKNKTGALEEFRKAIVVSDGKELCEGH